MKQKRIYVFLMAAVLFSACLSESEKQSIQENAEYYFQQRVSVAQDKMTLENFEELNPKRSRIIDEEYNYKHSLSPAGQEYYEKINRELRNKNGYTSNL